MMGLPPLAALSLIALVSAIVTLLVVRATSNQSALAGTRRELRAALYEIWIFRHDPAIVSRAVRESFRLNLRTLRLSLVPAVWLIVPFALLGAYLQSHYGYRALEVGRPAIVKVGVSPDAAVSAAERPRLVTPDGIRVEAAVWIQSKREMDWRIAPEQPGRFDVSVEYAGHRVSEAIAVSDGVLTSPFSRKADLLNQFWRRTEGIMVDYQPGRVDVFGMQCSWYVPFLILTAVFALALRRQLGVVL